MSRFNLNRLPPTRRNASQSLFVFRGKPRRNVDPANSASTSFDNPYVEWMGAYNDLSDRRTMVNVGMHVTLRVKGSAFRIKYASGGANPFNVSVDGGSYSAPTGSGGFIPVFSGLPDTWHDVIFRLASGYTGSASVFKTAAWEITGSDPKIAYHTGFGGQWESCYDTSFQSKGLISPCSTTASGGGSYPSVVSYGGFVDTTVYRRAKCSTIKVYAHAGATSKFTLWVDGTRYATVSDASSVGFVTLATNLDPNTEKEYAISTNSIANSSVIFGVFCSGGTGFSSTAVSARPTLACLGDSITQATTSLQQSSIGYCAKIALAKGWKPANRGISGNTTAQCLARVSEINSLNPEYVIVLTGRNDWGNSVQTDYTAILNSILTNTSAKILAVGSVPTTTPAIRITTNNSIEAAVTAVANSRVLYVNTDAMTGLSTFDGTHPDDAGYDSMVSFLMSSVNSHFV